VSAETDELRLRVAYTYSPLRRLGDGSMKFRLTAILSSAPGANRGTLFAAISMAVPLCGFRTLRALW
jgi:hypothetical protein